MNRIPPRPSRYAARTLPAALALLLAACASHTPRAAGAAQPAAQTQAAEALNPNCPRETGSRLPPTREDCARAGRSFSGQEMRDTGATNAADALRHLDPNATGQ